MLDFIDREIDAPNANISPTHFKAPTSLTLETSEFTARIIFFTLSTLAVISITLLTQIWVKAVSVSYTHLTLPTICSV